MNRITKINPRQQNQMLSPFSFSQPSCRACTLFLFKTNTVILFSWSQLLIICLFGVKEGLLDEDDKNKFLIQKWSLHAFTLWKIHLSLQGTVVCAKKNVWKTEPYSVAGSCAGCDDKREYSRAKICDKVMDIFTEWQWKQFHITIFLCRYCANVTATTCSIVILDKHHLFDICRPLALKQ